MPLSTWVIWRKLARATKAMANGVVLEDDFDDEAARKAALKRFQQAASLDLERIPKGGIVDGLLPSTFGKNAR